MLSQLFQGRHTRKLQDQLRQGLQLKRDLGVQVLGWAPCVEAGEGEGKAGPSQYSGSHLRRCLLQCHGLDLQVAERAVHLWSAWISLDQGLSPTLLGAQFLVQLRAQSQGGLDSSPACSRECRAHKDKMNMLPMQPSCQGGYWRARRVSARPRD